MRDTGVDTRRRGQEEEESLRMFFGDRRADLAMDEEATLREVSDHQEAVQVTLHVMIVAGCGPHGEPPDVGRAGG